MNRIQKYEDAIKSTASLEELGINETMYRAYCRTMELGNQFLNFNTVFSVDDVEEILQECYDHDIDTFTISVSNIQLMDLMWDIELKGGFMNGMTMVYDKDWKGNLCEVPAVFFGVMNK